MNRAALILLALAACADRRAPAKQHDAAPPAIAPAELDRLAKVQRDLDAGRVIEVRTRVTAEERPFVEQMFVVGAAIDRLYATQVGATAIADRVAPDAASRRLFERNRGARCASPALLDDPTCSAIPGGAAQPVAAYPAELQAQPGFCETLDEALLGPFTIVRDGAAVPYAEAWKPEMTAIAVELERAADLLPQPAEEAQATYLRAAASAFRTNDWFAADLAWSAAGQSKSAWYVRVGPDEVGWDPCGRKAGFHLTLARIDRAADAWREKLAPHVTAFEAELAAAAGPPYVAREVTFQLPELIEIVLNAGDDREPFGATLGQSLPNWGPAAARTVVMTNLYSDPDSQADAVARAGALLDKYSMPIPDEALAAGELSTILHEMTHNLGPSGDEAKLGGDRAYLIEELKAQTGALYLGEWLRQHRVIDDVLSAQLLVDDVTWCFRMIAVGPTDPYAQLCAIHVGYLTERRVLRWDPEAPAANGTDTGAFTLLEVAAMTSAIPSLMRTVAGIEARNDGPALDALLARYPPPPVIAERAHRFRPATFVYAIAPD